MATVSRRLLLSRGYASSRLCCGILARSLGSWTLSCCRDPGEQAMREQRHATRLTLTAANSLAFGIRLKSRSSKHHTKNRKKRASSVTATTTTTTPPPPPAPPRRPRPRPYATRSGEKKNSKHDPVAFAERVSVLLRKKDSVTALEAVRGAQTNGLDTIVAWNHLLEYTILTKGIGQAFRMYNDMKKRGGKPNEHTYTILLNGCANSRSKISLKIALSIHQSILRRKPELEPSIIHHNAVLNVCARNYDMDSMWKIAETIPESGPNGPDKATFTIILNAIHAAATRDVQALIPDTGAKRTSDLADDSAEFEGAIEDGSQEVLAKKASAVKQGKWIWTDVIHHWRNGAFMPDSALIFGMGRILLLGGTEQDYRDLFFLLHQTLGLPLYERLGEPRQAPRRDKDPQAVPSTLEADNGSVEGESGSEGGEEDFSNLFNPINLEEVRKAMEKRRGETGVPDLRLPTPTNLELCLALVAGRNLRHGLGVTRKYWDILTSTDGGYGVVPDHVSYHEYLRVLRKSRASARSLYIIREEMSPCKITVPKTFVIAMSSCARDRNNPNILNTAGQIVEIMGRDLQRPDPELLDRFMELVRRWTSRHAVPESQDKEEQYEARVAALTAALARLKPLMQRVQEAITHGEADTDTSPQMRRRRRLLPTPSFSTPEAISALQNYQQLLQRVSEPPFVNRLHTAPGTNRQDLDEEHARLRKFLGEYHNHFVAENKSAKSGRDQERICRG